MSHKIRLLRIESDYETDYDGGNYMSDQDFYFQIADTAGEYFITSRNPINNIVAFTRFFDALDFGDMLMIDQTTMDKVVKQYLEQYPDDKDCRIAYIM